PSTSTSGATAAAPNRGARYCLAVARATSPCTQPSSASATNSVAGTAVTCAVGRRRLISCWYAPPCTVPSVASTPMRPLRVAATAAAAPGSLTPRMGRPGLPATSAGSAAAEAVLHATTTAFTPRRTSAYTACCAYFSTVAAVLVPYGSRAVSPR